MAQPCIEDKQGLSNVRNLRPTQTINRSPHLLSHVTDLVATLNPGKH